MEEKRINEQESLELITRMISQTKQESAIGSGNVFLVWGYLCTFMSLAVFAITLVTKGGGWGWLYLAIPLLGFAIAAIVARRTSKKYNGPTTYQGKSINAIWGVLSSLFGAYAGICLVSTIFNWGDAHVWSGMFLLGLLLPWNRNILLWNNPQGMESPALWSYRSHYRSHVPQGNLH